MDKLKDKVFLVSDKCTSCRKNEFCLCVKIGEEKIMLCLTCIFEYFNDYDAKDELKGGKKRSEIDE